MSKSSTSLVPAIVALGFALYACGDSGEDDGHGGSGGAGASGGSTSPSTGGDASTTTTTAMTTATGGPLDVVEVLTAAGFTVTPAGMSADGALLFDLVLAQVNDHQNPAAGTHEHHLSLIHRGFDRPMNLVSTGYQNYLGFSELGLTAVLKANQLVLDKRFHNGNGDDWSLFTRAQVAADAHDVIERLNDAYTAAWISSGFSNGGVDVVSFRALYPQDVVGTVALGSPFMQANDNRFLAFFASVDQTCEDKLEAIQFAALGNRRTAVEPLIEDLSDAAGDTFVRVPRARAFEAAGLSYPWLFWQYWGSQADCDALVDPATATDVELADEVYEKTSVFGAYPMSDGYLGFFGAYFYEVQQDSGWPTLPRAALEAAGLIPPTLIDMEVGLVPDGVQAPPFDTAANLSLKAFAIDGDGVIFIYSDSDPWSTGAVEPSAGSTNDVYWITNGNHNSDITELNPTDRAAVYATLEAWTGVTPE